MNITLIQVTGNNSYIKSQVWQAFKNNNVSQPVISKLAYQGYTDASNKVYATAIRNDDLYSFGFKANPLTFRLVRRVNV